MVCTLLIAPQTTEFGAKVALLSGLVVLCVARLFLERFLPAPGSERGSARARSRARAERRPVPDARSCPRARSDRRRDGRGDRRDGGRGGSAGPGVARRGERRGVGRPGRPTAARRARGSLDAPTVTVDPEVTDRGDLSQADAQAIAVTLAENLEVEAQALRRGEKSLLPSVDDGERLTTMQGRVDDVIETGGAVVPHYTFDALHVVLIHAEGQSGLSLGFEARGTVEEVTYGVDGSERSRTTSPFARTFVLSRPTGARWLLVDTQPNT